MTRRNLVTLSSVVLLGAAVAAYALLPSRSGEQTRRRASKLKHEPPQRAAHRLLADIVPAFVPAEPPHLRSSVVPAKSVRADEMAIMAELRALAQSAPERSLALAHEGDTRFPGSEDAPERAWFKIRSLVNLGRFEEARNEAAVMVDTYRDTPWAGDVERHLLTHPLRHASERGSLPE